MSGKKNYFRITSVIIGITLLITAMSCSDSYFNDLNTPKDEIVASNLGTSSIGQAFAYSQYHAMWGQFGAGGYNQVKASYGLMWVQYIASTSDIQKGDNFSTVGRWDELSWNYFYETAIRQIDLVKNKTEEEGMDIENAIAKVWSAVAFHQLTDIWGPIPYSEFGNGKKSVKYDSQESIYHDFFKTLDEAVVVLQNNIGENAFGSNDLVYEGNIKQWIKFANSMKLRLAIRIRYVEPQLAKKEAEKAISAGVIEDRDNSALVKTTDNSRHPLATITAWGEFRAAGAMESTLEGYKDPRLEIYLSPAVNGDSDGDGSPYEGLRNGLLEERSSGLNDSYSQMGKQWLPLSQGGTNPPLEVMRAAEVYFLRAEGALQGWNMGGTAEDLYNEGIRSSLKSRTEATDTEINSYISSSNTPVAVDDEWQAHRKPVSNLPVAFMTSASNEKKLEQIITQKWLSLYPNGLEAWAELRRTGYPKLYPIEKSTNPDIPEDGVNLIGRLKFVPDEYNNNRNEVEKAAKLLNGPDAITTKLWWDAKP